MSRSPDRYSPSASDAASSSPPAPPREEASDRALGSTDGVDRGTSANAALLESTVSASSAPLRSTIDAPQSRLNANPSFTRNHDPFVRQKSHRNPNFSKRCTDASSSSPFNHSPREAQHPTSPLDILPLMPRTQSNSTYHRAGHSGSRRGNHGGGVGGTPAHHLRHGNHREHDRGGYGWMSPRGFNTREPQTPTPFLQQRGDPRPFIQPQLLQQPPPSPTMMPFFGMPPQFRHVMPPMGYEFPPLYYLSPPLPPPPPPLESMPIITHQAPSVVPPAGFPSPADYQRLMLVKQIEYYFSPENLCKDHYLRQNMDDHGWVAVSLIASFNRVKQLTHDIPYILDALQGSTVVEVHGEKLRRRGDWMRWILPHQYDSASSPRSPQQLHPDSILSRLHAFGLNEDPSRHNGTG